MTDILKLLINKKGNVEHYGFEIDNNGIKNISALINLQKPVFYSCINNKEDFNRHCNILNINLVF